MASAQPGDSFLVNRNGTSYYFQLPDPVSMASVQDEDLLLINRSGTSYKITGAELKDSFETFSVDTPTLLKPQANATVPDPNAVALEASEYSAQPSVEIVPFGQSRWQIATDSSFSADSLVVNAVNNSPTFFEVTTEGAETDPVGGVTLNGADYDLTFTGNKDLDRFEIGEAVSCNATPLAPDMSGLRFDGDRTTFLSRDFNQSSTAGTVSVWIKVTDYGDYGYIWKTSNDLGIYIDTSGGTYNGKLSISAGHYASATPGQAYSTDTIPLNEWVNVVFRTGDGTNTAGLWINGVSQANSTTAFTTTGYAITDGWTRIGEDNGANYFNGYMSAFYFVDGQSLPPSVFGYTNAGASAWAPRTPEEIQADIDYRFAASSPYDTRPLMTEDWSSTGTDTGQSATPWSLAFDGVVGGGAGGNYMQCVQDCEVTFTGLTVAESLEIWGNREVIINPDTTNESLNITGSAAFASWVPVPNFTGSLDKIKAIVNSAGGASISGIKVDGRILVDGPANNSVNWSEGGINGDLYNANTWSAAFNGTVDADASPWIRQTNTSFTFPEGVGGVLKISLASTGSNAGNVSITVGGETKNTSFSSIGAETTTEFSSVAELGTITLTPGGIGAYITQMQIDDVLLVDSGYQWNTSEIWSDSLSSVNTSGVATGSIINAQNAFNGNAANVAYVDNTANRIRFTIPSSLSTTSNFAVISTGAGTLTAYLQSGSTVSVTASTLTDLGSASTIGSYFELGTDSSVSNVNISLIQADDKILVNNTPFGASGFYLPFDPDAEGVNYSQHWSGSIDATNGPTGAFDGNLVTYTRPSVSSSCTFTYTAIPYTSLEIMGCLDSNAGATITVNGVNVTSAFPQSTTLTWVDLSSFSGLSSPLTTVELTATSTAQSRISAIKINGKLLVDHNNIGVDASGNQNNFYDQNFAVGNTSQVWSSGPITGAWYAGNWQNVFNGTTDTKNLTYSQGSVYTGLSGTDKTSLYLPTPIIGRIGVIGSNGTTGQAAGAGSSIIRMLDNSGNVVLTYDVSANAPGVQIPFMYQNTATLIAQIEVQSVAVDAGCGLWAVSVDGVPLIDANIQDTVIDTPVTNYAVWSNTGATNGNLSFAAAGGTNNTYTQIPVSPAPYYSEISVDTATDTSTNFVGIGYVRATDAPNNTSNAAPFDGIQVLIYSDAIYLFEDNSSTQTQTVTGDFPVGTIVGLTLENASSDSPAGALYVNGVQVAVYGLKSSFSTVYGCSRTNVSQGTTNFGQQPFAYATNNMDGTCEVPATYNTSREWSANPINISTSQGGGPTGAFNGLSNSQGAWSADGSQPQGFTFTPPIENITSFKIACDPQNEKTITYTDKDGNVTTAVFSPTAGDGYNPSGQTPPAPSSLSSVTIQNNNNSVSQISSLVVNGSMLVDSSLWNTSENWSNGTKSGTVNTPGWVLAFNGAEDQGVGTSYDGLATLTLPAAVPFTTLRVYGQVNPNATGLGVYMNDTQLLNMASSPAWLDVTSQVTSPLTSIAVEGNGGLNSTFIGAIEVDGKILVDKSLTEDQTYLTLVAKDADALSLDILTGTVASVSPAGDGAMSITPDEGMDWSLSKGNNVIGAQKSGLEADTTYYARVMHSSNNGIDSSFSAANQFNTGAPLPPTPDTLPGGLRFDNDRATKLSTTLTGSGNQVWTFSTWFKQTGFIMGNNFPALIVAGTSQSNYDYIYFNAETGQAGLVGSSGDIRKDFSGTFTNKWTNVVVSVDGTNVNMSVNGVTQSTASTADWVINNPDQHDIGFGTDVYIDGYLSEVYFVDGQALEPTMFGQDINGVWTPNLNTDIPFGANGFYLPFDPAAVGVNYSSRTSTDKALLVGAVSSLFNGTVAEAVGTNEPDPDGAITFTFSPALGDGTSDMEVYTSLAGSSKMQINGGTVYDATSNPTDGWHSISEKTISTLKLYDAGNNTAAYIYGFKVGSSQLVDHNNIGVDASGNNNDFYDQNFAVGNTRMIWSSTVIPSSPDGGAVPSILPGETVSPITNLFDGSIETHAQVDSTNGKQTRITFNPPITGNNIQIYVDQSGTATDKTANGDSPLTNNGWNNVIGDTLTYIQAVSGAGSGYFWLNAISVDGVLLVDSNIQDTVLDKPVTDYAIFTPWPSDVGTGATVTDGSLVANGLNDTSAYVGAFGTQSVSSGNYYYEVTITQNSSGGTGGIGFTNANNPGADPSSNSTMMYSILMSDNAVEWYQGTNKNGPTSISSAPFTTYETFGIAIEMDTNRLRLFWNNGGAEPAGMDAWTNTWDSGSVSDSGVWLPDFACAGVNMEVNFGQHPFKYGDSIALDQGKVTVVGTTYNTYFTPINQSTGSGDLFYLESFGDAVTASQLYRWFGLPATASPADGIYALTEQPTYDVKGYTKNHILNKYAPIRTYENEFHRLQALLANTSQAWSQGDSYVNGQIIHYSDQYFVVTEDYTVGASETFSADAAYLTPIHS